MPPCFSSPLITLENRNSVAKQDGAYTLGISMVLIVLEEEFDPVLISLTIAHHATRSDRRAGICWCELHGDLLSYRQLHTCEHRQPAFIKFIAAALDEFYLISAGRNDTYRDIEFITRPAASRWIKLWPNYSFGSHTSP